jgi:hypothetical protein
MPAAHEIPKTHRHRTKANCNMVERRPDGCYAHDKYGTPGRAAMKLPYCSECTIGEDRGPSHAIGQRQRMARAVAGVGFLLLAWAFLYVPVQALAWPLASIAVWFGISHLVAGWTGYPDCPELGAVATLLSRRYVRTRCAPWAWVDRWLEPQPGERL